MHAPTQRNPMRPGIALALLVQASLLQAESIPLDALNSPLPEYGVVRGPDGYYFARSSAAFGENGAESILVLRPDGRIEPPPWASPEHNESDPYFRSDFTRVCFVSDRPDPADPHPGDADIWCAHRSADSWSPPSRVPEPVNSPAREFSPVITLSAELYFASDRPGGQGLGDLYRAVDSGRGTWDVTNLGPPVNSPGGEWNLDISPTGDSLLFEASHRFTNRSVSGDLYLSRRLPDGWSTPVPLSRLNATGSELMPRFHASGQLVYSASRDGDAQIRLVAAGDFLPVGPRLLAVSRSAHELVVIDPRTLNVLERRPAGSGPHEVAITEDGRRYLIPSHGVFPVPHSEPIRPDQMRWSESESTGYIVGDLMSQAATREYRAPCERPHGITMTAQGDRAWLTCEDSGDIVELAPDTGEVLRRLHTGPGVHKVLYLARKNRLLASNPETGEAYLVHLDDASITPLNTGAGAEALAASADENTGWVANGFARTLCRIDVESAEVDGCWPTGGAFPIALAVDERLDVIWIARSASADLAVFSIGERKVVREIPLPSNPLGMALDATGGRLFVTLPRLNRILVLDTGSATITGHIDDIMEADDLDFVPTAAFGSTPDT
ncbi:hypothetical protein [Elongatibacter sediminis]|uniref:Uncharacterized protein n=1 Tax=Elongatibacter sediminis TaxID=3119006 RepID=A0AAW9R9L1_9GAMM